MASDANTLSPEDLALLERLARRVVDLRMEVPAILALETGKPLSLLAGQAMVFFEPLLQSLFSLPDYDRVRRLVERREAIEALMGRIEGLAEERRHGRSDAGASERGR